MHDTSDSKQAGPLWQCDRCSALQSKRSLRPWQTPDAQYTLCDECTLSIVLMWLEEHQEQIQAQRRAAVEGP